MSHALSLVKSGGGAAYLLSVAGLSACKDASLFDAFSGPWIPSSTFYKLLEIERAGFGGNGISRRVEVHDPTLQHDPPFLAGLHTFDQLGGSACPSQ
jgi:hypothetical protein